MRHNYKELQIWKDALELCDIIMKITKTFPYNQRSLADQMRRGAISVPSNIAEGAGRGSDPDFKQFLWYSHGSLYELDTQVIISERAELVTKELSDTLRARIEALSKMIAGLIRKIS